MSDHPTIEVDGKLVKVYEVSVTNKVVDQRDLGLYEEHERGRNWIAVITPNRAKAGGLEREFLDRVRTTFYATDAVKAGDFIEVGADYLTTAGRRHPKRRVFRVLILRANTWVIRDAETPTDTLTIPPYTPEAEAARKALSPQPEDVLDRVGTLLDAAREISRTRA